MNLLPLAALLIACLALAVAIVSLVTVEKLRRRVPIRRQHQVSGHGSVQVQSGGNLWIEGREQDAKDAAERIIKMGRHL